ncbi:hypothetical protein KJS94_06150 [Flavihumibacter rivuli]|uniref:hypothetical protein n=1 Tax=Flavihumibacter rivuli TaxID=2838156 RepID=UPI001BDED46F|nr:hypothetical protein [Flavihumibacter rivuli]ULQ57778.1 hypothetical protein KJS94_06150 [Flavihumibacter rivuli]
MAAEDPSQFLTRVEVINETQHFDKDFSLNQSTLRMIVKIGKRFTTRVDIPFTYNSRKSPAGYSQFGLGDISFRLLGYKIVESKLTALTASVEISLNTAASPSIGTGKNILIPMLTFSRLVPQHHLILGIIAQQGFSMGGDESRNDFNYTKLQPFAIHMWSRRIWSILAPEMFIDYIGDDVSLNLETRTGYAPTPRFNIWLAGGVGLFGNFPGRYQWDLELGTRYFLMRKKKPAPANIP